MKRLALLLLLLSSVNAEARCLSRGEAVAAHPKTHLYWSVGKNGKCWSNSLARARQDAKGDPGHQQQRRVIYKDDPPLEPAPPPLPPPGKHPAPPLQTTPKTIEDFPQWAWVQKARENPREEEKEFSSFDGEPPDVWPLLEKSSTPKLLIMFVLILLTMIACVLAWRLYGRHYVPRKDSQWSSTRNNLLRYRNEYMRLCVC